MYSKKVIRYYSDCGRGFWRKQTAITHDKNCKCWSNPKFRTCISCKFKNFGNDSNGMEHEPQYLHNWQTNNCQHSENGKSVRDGFEHIIKDCKHYEHKNQLTQ